MKKLIGMFALGMGGFMLYHSMPQTSQGYHYVQPDKPNEYLDKKRRKESQEPNEPKVQGPGDDPQKPKFMGIDKSKPKSFPFIFGHQHNYLEDTNFSEIDCKPIGNQPYHSLKDYVSEIATHFHDDFSKISDFSAEVLSLEEFEMDSEYYKKNSNIGGSEIISFLDKYKMNSPAFGPKYSYFSKPSPYGYFTFKTPRAEPPLDQKIKECEMMFDSVKIISKNAPDSKGASLGINLLTKCYLHLPLISGAKPHIDAADFYLDAAEGDEYPKDRKYHLDRARQTLRANHKVIRLGEKILRFVDTKDEEAAYKLECRLTAKKDQVKESMNRLHGMLESPKTYKLRKEMEVAVATEAYERAAELRDKIKELEA